MKKLLTLSVAFGIAVAAMAQQAVPYHSNIGDASQGWTVINIDPASPTFEAGGASNFAVANCGEENGMIYNHLKKDDVDFYAPDDWLISPGITMKAGVEYRIRFKFNCALPSITHYDVRVGKAGTVEALTAGQQLLDYNSETNPDASKWYPGNNSSVYKTVPMIFTPTEDDVYYFGFHLYDVSLTSSTIAFKITGFDVQTNMEGVIPAAPGNFFGFQWTIAPNRELKHTITWTLPTLDSEGLALTESTPISAVKLYRGLTNTDDAMSLVATLPGTATEWVDTEESGLTAGRPWYRAEVVLSNGNVSPYASTQANGWIGMPTVKELPWTETFNKTNVNFSYNENYIRATGPTENAAGKWDPAPNAYSPTSIKWTPTSGKPEDGYLIFPPIKVDKTGIHELKSKIQLANAAAGNTLEVHLVKGTPTTAEAFSSATKIADWENEKNTTDQEQYAYFNVEEPGIYTLAIHRYSEKAANTYIISVKSISVKQSGLTTQPVSDLTSTMTENGVKLSWVNPAKSNVGTELSKISKIDVIRFNNVGDTAVITLTENLTPGGATSYTDEPATPGIYNYYVIPYLDGNAPGQTPKKVFTDFSWVGSKLQTLPYTLDFTLQSTISDFHQRYVVPQQQLWSYGVETGGYTSTNFSLVTNGFNIYATSKNRAYKSYAMSSPFDLKKGYYKLSLSVSGGNTDGTFPLYAGFVKDGDESHNVMGKTAITTGIATGTNNVRALNSVTIQANEAGLHDLYFILDGTVTTGTLQAFTIRKIQLERLSINPKAPTGLKVTPNADGAREAVISWTNPTGSTMTGETITLSKAVIYRNGEPVYTLTEGLELGKTSSWTDTTIPDAGSYKYKVVVYGIDQFGEEGESAPTAEVTSAWIGTGKDLPYEPADFSEWSFPGTDKYWSIDAKGYLTYDNPEFDTNDWVISPRMNFENGKYYTFEFTPWVGEGEGIPFEVYHGTGMNVADMTTKLLELQLEDDVKEINATPVQIHLFATSAPESTRKKALSADDFVAVPAGVGTLGFRIPDGGVCKVKDVKVNDADFTPVGVDQITADKGITFNGNKLMLANAADVVVCDLSAKKVLGGHGVTELDLSGLAKGVYIVTARIDGETVSLKVVK